jgi:hypothetical protein
MPDQGPPRSWRNRLRIRVRAFFVLVLFVGSGLGWMVHNARVQRDVVAAIRKARGSTYYEWQYKQGVSSAYWTGEPWGPKWLVKQLGVDYFGRVVAVQHGGWVSHSGMFSDEDMVQVGRLGGLVELWLIESSVTDAGLAHLKGLTGLERIFLHGSQVTDAGLVHLTRLTRLKELCLDESEVTDAGLARLTRLPSLRTLDVTRTRVTNAGLKHFQQAMPTVRVVR